MKYGLRLEGAGEFTKQWIISWTLLLSNVPLQQYIGYNSAVSKDEYTKALIQVRNWDNFCNGVVYFKQSKIKTQKKSFLTDAD